MRADNAAAVIDRWLDRLLARHLSHFDRREFLKAVRALSARYVERRNTIAARSPIDSPGKRAAFAAFFAPLHLLVAREVVRRLAIDRQPIDQITDLGCGTGVASAAWALSTPSPGKIHGIDINPWAVAEAAWNWRTLGLAGRARKGDMVVDAARLSRRRTSSSRSGVVLGWSVNELDAVQRARLLPSLMELAHRGATMLVIEPLSRRAVPWWDEWAEAFVQAGGRADEWKFEAALPARLRDLDEAAGFARDALSARSLSIRPNTQAPV